MDKKTHSQLLAEVLLLPFIHDSFNQNDPICRYAATYGEVTNQRILRGVKARKQILKDYQNSKKALIQLFSKDLRWNHLDDVQLLLEMFYPGLKLTEFYDAQKNDLGRFYIQHIFDLARTFITFRDGIVSIRNWSKETDPFLQSYTEFEKIELWNHISRTIASDLLIAACYVNFNVSNIDDMQNVPNLIYLADMPLKNILNKGVAETHMHANAGISYHDLWNNWTSLLSESLLQKNKESSSQLFCTLFKLCSAIYLSDGSKESFEDYLLSNKDKGLYFKTFFDCVYSENLPDKLTQIKLEPIWNDLKKQFKIKTQELQDSLFCTVYKEYRDRGTSSEMLWYYHILKYLKHNYDSLLCKCFIKYIRFKNSFFKDKIQQTRISGLDYFQSHYDNATEIPRLMYISEEKQAELRYNSIFEEQCKTGNLAILEMKITPRVQLNNTNLINCDTIKTKTLVQIQKIINAYKNYIKKRLSLISNKNNIKFPKLGLIYHFIKQQHSDNFSGVNCGIYNSSEYDNYNYSAMRTVNINFLNALTELLSEYPLLSDYIVGIDAASIENATEPWVFAPIFRHARSHKNIVPYSAQKGSNIQNIGFTYHVGEDFRHIISGLRHIDEVLTYFDYRSGDRLGHAIALGIDIDNLLTRNNIVAIPIMEHLENLLWMWQNAKSSHFGNVPENLEFKIMETARNIYQNSLSGIDVYTLWRVYQAKFNLIDNGTKSYAIDGNDCILLEKLKKDKSWSFKDLLCTHFCPCFHEIYSKPILVPIKQEELTFYKELQKNLLNKVERMGIYVETNPSSNLAIGDIPSIFHHPILQLNNKGLSINGINESCVMVSINSDDPIVFSTFAENEIAYIYYALLNAGCKREEALNWIDKIRLQGIESTFIKSNKTLDEMLNDFDQILSYNKLQ